MPWNIFTQGGVTPAALKFLTEPGTAHGQTEESIFEFNVTGDLGKYGWKSPWATDGIGVNIGTESRWDRLVFAPDQAELSGDLSGFSGASVAVNNAIGVEEGYFETRIPLAEKQPFAYDLYIEGGARYSDYSTSGGVTTYKVGGQWSPIPDFTLRGSYDHAIRAASILEAFSPETVTNTTAFSGQVCRECRLGGHCDARAVRAYGCDGGPVRQRHRRRRQRRHGRHHGVSGEPMRHPHWRQPDP